MQKGCQHGCPGCLQPTISLSLAPEATDVFYETATRSTTTLRVDLGQFCASRRGDASGAESRLYLGAQALDTRERYTSEKLATRGRGGVFSMPTKKVVILRARVTQSRLPRRCKHARRRQLLGGRRGTVASGRLHHGRRSPARGLRSAALKHSRGPGRELFSRFHACKRPTASPTLSFLNLDYLSNLLTE